MIELLGSIVGFAFDMVSMAITLVFDVVEFVFGLLGGILSLAFTLGGFALVIALICVFIRRRRRKQETKETVFVDENGEEFVSYYHQEK